MKISRLIFCVLILALATSVYAKRPPGGGTCQDVPISWEFLGDGTGPEAIFSDGLGVYSPGGAGIANSVIHSAGTCEGSGAHSKDATMAFANPRLLKFRINDAIPGTILSGQGGPAQYGTFLSNGQLNIRNIVGFGAIPPGQPATYYTKASGTFFAPDNKKFLWQSMPVDSSCPFPSICVANFTAPSLPANLNQPEQTAWVQVTYTPASGTDPDTWYVDGEFINPSFPTIVQRMTLFYDWKPNKPPIHYGQYSLPFRIIIKALAPLP